MMWASLRMAMASAAGTPRRLKLLLLSDLYGHIRRVTTLCEQVVCSHDGDLDAVLVCGGHVASRDASAYARNEGSAAAEGDMMALISRLETIVCRVIYVPGESDPPTTRPSWEEVTPNLTQYSINCYARTEQLVFGVAVMGEERYMKLLGDGKDPADSTELLIVLRDSSAATVLPRPFALENSHVDMHHLEIVGGPHRTSSAGAHVVFPGSLRLGQFTILELEQRETDDSWAVASTRLMQLSPLDDDGDGDQRLAL